MKRYAISTGTLPGFNQVGSFVPASEVTRCSSRGEALTAAQRRADFGAPFHNQFCVYLCRLTRQGWKVTQQINSEVWLEEEEE